MKLTKSTVLTLKPGEREQFVWDGELKGFGIRIAPTGRKSFIVQYRVGGGRGGRARRITIGTFPTFSADKARSRAKDVLAQARVLHDAALERDHARKADTVDDLVTIWLDEGVGRDRRTGRPRSESNIAGERGRVDAHVRPLLGKKRLSELSKIDIEWFRDQVARGACRSTRATKLRGRARVRGGEGTATRTVRMLSSILAFGVDQGLLPANPANGVKVAQGRRVERFLSTEEVTRLGAALDAAERAGAHPHGIAVIRLLALTGARRGEILALRWAEVDLAARKLHLEHSKTGQKTIPLSEEAGAILKALPRFSGSPFVFPASSGEGHYQGLERVWRAVLSVAKFDKHTRLHDLRHTYASVGAAHGFGLSLVGAVLGHRSTSTTARYAHSAETRVDEVNAAISAHIGRALGVSVAPPAPAPVNDNDPADSAKSAPSR